MASQRQVAALCAIGWFGCAASSDDDSSDRSSAIQGGRGEVFLEVSSSLANDPISCNAVALGGNWLLTAAHCVPAPQVAFKETTGGAFEVALSAYSEATYRARVLAIDPTATDDDPRRRIETFPKVSVWLHPSWTTADNLRRALVLASEPLVTSQSEIAASVAGNLTQELYATELAAYRPLVFSYDAETEYGSSVPEPRGFRADVSDLALIHLENQDESNGPIEAFAELTAFLNAQQMTLRALTVDGSVAGLGEELSVRTFEDASEDAYSEAYDPFASNEESLRFVRKALASPDVKGPVVACEDYGLSPRRLCADAGAGPGSSGAGVVDASGRLVGILSSGVLDEMDLPTTVVQIEPLGNANDPATYAYTGSDLKTDVTLLDEARKMGAPDPAVEARFTRRTYRTRAWLECALRAGATESACVEESVAR